MANKDKKQIKSIFNHHKTVSELLVASDGNIFLSTTAGKNMCRDHCKRNSLEFEVVTRDEAFKEEAEETGDEDANKGESGLKKVETSTDQTSAWKELPWGQIVDFATKKGLEPQTKMPQGKAVLIEEVQQFLDTLEIGGNDITNHNNQGE